MINSASRSIITVLFQTGPLCQTDLLETLESWTAKWDSPDMLGVDTVYLDYQKAFDRVPHKRLLLKLKAYCIEGHVLAWSVHKYYVITEAFDLHFKAFNN